MKIPTHTYIYIFILIIFIALFVMEHHWKKPLATLGLEPASPVSSQHAWG